MNKCNVIFRDPDDTNQEIILECSLDDDNMLTCTTKVGENTDLDKPVGLIGDLVSVFTKALQGNSDVEDAELSENDNIKIYS